MGKCGWGHAIVGPNWDGGGQDMSLVFSYLAGQSGNPKVALGAGGGSFFCMMGFGHWGGK